MFARKQINRILSGVVRFVIRTQIGNTVVFKRIRVKNKYILQSILNRITVFDNFGCIVARSKRTVNQRKAVNFRCFVNVTSVFKRAQIERIRQCRIDFYCDIALQYRYCRCILIFVYFVVASKVCVNQHSQNCITAVNSRTVFVALNIIGSKRNAYNVIENVYNAVAVMSDKTLYIVGIRIAFRCVNKSVFVYIGNGSRSKSFTVYNRKI